MTLDKRGKGCAFSAPGNFTLRHRETWSSGAEITSGHGTGPDPGAQARVACLGIRFYLGAIVSDEPVLKQTPLFCEHERLGAKMTGFGGWNMPVYYSSIVDEHRAVRNQGGVFDISHMGQIDVSGPAANSWLNKLLSNNVERLAITQGQYTLLLNEQGGVIDDLIVYRRHDNEYFLVVNAAKIDEDFAWMEGYLSGDASFLNCSSVF